MSSYSRRTLKNGIMNIGGDRNKGKLMGGKNNSCNKCLQLLSAQIISPKMLYLNLPDLPSNIKLGKIFFKDCS
jgi:hypothetical protein